MVCASHRQGARVIEYIANDVALSIFKFIFNGSIVLPKLRNSEPFKTNRRNLNKVPKFVDL
jgi:hypothetical protein